ncbi:MAG: tryptophan--tRNA ligase [Leptospiraceae bacterium]|nr:tryptophan--tRNA ligase [Leptospiraceae bacterium]
MRVLSGIQPSGRPHLGNYFSMMKRMIEYQKTDELFCFIASYHSMTSVTDGNVLAQNILETAADFLALGLDPAKSVFWVQSDVPEVCELAWILSNHITVPQLELAHSYKDKIANGLSPGVGLFSYPVLMAADILLFGSEKVPVGKDQKQHLEITRDIAERFNKRCDAEVLVMPQPDILENVALVPGLDGRKMSKSYNNVIYPFESEKKLRKSIMAIQTDSTPVDEPKSYTDSVLFDIYSLFLDTPGKSALRDRFQTPGEGYGHIKQSLYEAVLDYFRIAREKRAAIIRRPDDIRDILRTGAERARSVARPLIEKVRQSSGLAY